MTAPFIERWCSSRRVSISACLLGDRRCGRPSILNIATLEGDEA